MQLPQTMQVASVPLGLDQCSTCSAKLPFIQKAAEVVVIVELARIQDYEEGGGVCTR